MNARSEMKKCSQCHVEKPMGEFSRSGRGLQLRSYCNACKKEMDRRYRTENRETVNAAKEAWRKRQPPKRQKSSPEQDRAWRAVERAIARGAIASPAACEDCGRASSRLSGHHDDYAKPLDVRWLCGSCHALLHRRQERLCA